MRFISLNASREQAVALMTPEDLPDCHIACPNPTELWLDMQAKWLDAVLKDNPNKWAVAVFHQPVFSTSEGRDEVDVRAAWLPVFQRNDIDLVLMGHDHTYARGYVNADATDTPGMTTGPVYTVTVSGPKYYELSPVDNNVWTQNGATQVVRAGHTSTFQGIHVSEDQIRYESIVAAKWDDESTTDVPVGGMLDSFTITKYDNGEKYVTEDGVPIPEPSSTGPIEEEPETPEVPADDPADVPLGHEVVGTFSTPTVAQPGPTTVNEATGVVYVADGSPEGTGTIQAIDPETGAVIDSFEAGAAVRDLSYDSAFNGVLVVLQDGRIASFLTNPSVFGDPYIPPIPTGMPVISMQYDAFTGQVFLALEDGTIAWLDEDFAVAGNANVGTGVSAIRLDDTTGMLYVTYDNATDGQPALRLFETRNGMTMFAEYALDAGASALDIDMETGIAYVGHSAPAGQTAAAVDAAAANGGLSVVDLLGETVTRFETIEYGESIAGVGVDDEKGIAYLASATSSPAAMIVVGRQQAPSIDQSPVPQTVDAGQTVTFGASAHGVPAPVAGWEARAAGDDAWVMVDGASSDTLEVVATEALNGTQYRAVYTNRIGGQDYSTRSASATLRIAGLEVPGGDPGTDDPGTSDPGTSDPGQPVPDEPGADAPRDGDLADTGAEPFGAAVAAVLLMLAGAVVVVVRRRRSTQG